MNNIILIQNYFFLLRNLKSDVRSSIDALSFAILQTKSQNGDVKSQVQDFQCDDVNSVNVN